MIEFVLFELSVSIAILKPKDIENREPINIKNHPQILGNIVSPKTIFENSSPTTMLTNIIIRDDRYFPTKRSHAVIGLDKILLKVPFSISSNMLSPTINIAENKNWMPINDVT